MLVASHRRLALIGFVTTLGMANRSNAETPSDGRWLLGVESGRYAPLGVFGASVAYSLTPRLSVGAGLGVGFANEETFERPYAPWAIFGKLNLYQNGPLRIGLSLGYSVEKRVTAATLHRPNRPTETIEWRTPYGGGRLNQSMFAQWRRGTFVATGSLGVYRALASPQCFYDNGLNQGDFSCESGLGATPNEPSLWQGWASVGIGWAPQKSIPAKDDRDPTSGPDPALDRVVFAPTANTLPKGAVSIRNTTLAYFEIAYGLSENSQLTAFGISPAILHLGANYLSDENSNASRYLQVWGGLSFKVRAQPREGNLVHLAWVTFAGTGPLLDREQVSVLQTGPVISRCFDRNCQSVVSTHLLIGPMYVNDPYYNRSDSVDGEMQLGVSGRFRFTEHLGFAVEAQMGPYVPLMGAATLRVVTRSFFLEAGAMGIAPEIIAPIVSLGWTSF